MGSPSNIEISLPINGMTSSISASQVESALQGLPGVSNVAIDLAAGQARLVYDPAKADILSIQQAVEDAGYFVPTEKITLSIRGMTCMGCAAHVEGALTDLVGVISADVTLRPGSAVVEYIQGLVTVDHMRETVRTAGYEA